APQRGRSMNPKLWTLTGVVPLSIPLVFGCGSERSAPPTPPSLTAGAGGTFGGGGGGSSGRGGSGGGSAGDNCRKLAACCPSVTGDLAVICPPTLSLNSETQCATTLATIQAGGFCVEGKPDAGLPPV